jgi:hypothetical protein
MMTEQIKIEDLEDVLDETVVENLVLRTTNELWIPEDKYDAFLEEFQKRCGEWGPNKEIGPDEIVELVKKVWEEIGID